MRRLSNVPPQREVPSVADPQQVGAGVPTAAPGRPARVAELRPQWPFAVAAVAALLAIGLPPGRTIMAAGIAAAALTVMIAVALVVIPASRPPGWLEAMPALAYFVVVGLLRHAEGGAVSGYGPLVLLPVFWLALYGTRPHLLAAIAGAGLTFIVPLLMFGDPQYPSPEWRRAIMWLIVAPVAGLTTQRLVQQVREAARTDVVTGVLNRRGWNEAIDAARARGRRTREPLSLALIDIDGFKDFNDHHGHRRGDALLADAASAWRAVIREIDVIARWGGDEFAVLLPEADAAQASIIIDRLRRATPRGITCSIGLAAWDGQEPAEELIQRADSALYDAKRAGRNRTVVAASSERARYGASADDRRLTPPPGPPPDGAAP